MTETQKLTNLNSEDYTVDIDRNAHVPVDDDEIHPFDDLNDAPGKFSWNPMDWLKEFQQDWKEFSWAMTEKRRVVRKISNA